MNDSAFARWLAQDGVQALLVPLAGQKDAIALLQSAFQAGRVSIQVELGENVGAAALSKRERIVLHQLVDGVSNKEIGERLNITEGTVKAHVHFLMQKIGVVNRSQAAIWAVTHADELKEIEG
jgi:DNA-binding NarL/FixJ family response regulator